MGELYNGLIDGMVIQLIKDMAEGKIVVGGLSLLVAI